VNNNKVALVNEGDIVQFFNNLWKGMLHKGHVGVTRVATNPNCFEVVPTNKEGSVTCQHENWTSIDGIRYCYDCYAVWPEPPDPPDLPTEDTEEPDELQ